MGKRMDAIERRLAYLEANLAGEAPDDDPRYSCQPTRDDRYVENRPSLRVADDMRERASERAQLADLAADKPWTTPIDDGPLWGSSEHFQSLVTRHCTAHKTVERYEASLRALLALLQPERPVIHRAELCAWIETCLDGGTIYAGGKRGE